MTSKNSYKSKNETHFSLTMYHGIRHKIIRNGFSSAFSNNEKIDTISLSSLVCNEQESEKQVCEGKYWK